MVICVGLEVLTKVNVPEAPGANAVPELFCHMMELPSNVLAQPKEFPALDGFDGKLLPPNVQPYQKPFRLKLPVFCRVIV